MTNRKSYHVINFLVLGFVQIQIAFAQRLLPDEHEVITPVIPWDGDKLYGQSDCLPWETVAAMQLSSQIPDLKKPEIESKACKLSHGIECINIVGSNGASRDTCACMISIGSRPVKLPDENDNMHCYIPAGLGWVSECFENGIPPDSLGFSTPYGDPRGSGPDPPRHVDQIITLSGDRTIEYLKWNSIKLRCVPNAACREGPTYIGRRCGCLKDTIFDRNTGTCSSALRIYDCNRMITVLTFFGTLVVLVSLHR